MASAASRQVAAARGSASGRALRERLLELVDGWDERVEQRLVAEVRLPALLDSLDRGAQRGDHVVRARLGGRRQSCPRAGRRFPRSARGAADALGEDDRGLLQEAAGGPRSRARPSRSGRSRTRAPASSRSRRPRRPRPARRSTSRCRPPSGRWSAYDQLRLVQRRVAHTASSWGSGRSGRPRGPPASRTRRDARRCGWRGPAPARPGRRGSRPRAPPRSCPRRAV